MRTVKPKFLRRGGAYVAVLALSMIVTAIAVGAIAIVRAQARGSDALSDAAEARLYALSAIELGRLWISQDSSWRANHPNGAWATNQPIGNGTFTLEGTDPVDGILANRPHDPLVLKATGTKGSATQIVQVTLAAQPVPLPALKYALHAGGQVHPLSGKQINSGFATLSTNGSLRNEGLIIGNVEAMSSVTTGNVTGTVTIPATTKVFPPGSVVEMYALLGTEIDPGSSLDKEVLAPGRDPYGATNADGVYVIRPSGDFTLRRTRINGTLVIVCPAGRTVTIKDQVFLQPYRSDYPALIVVGNVDFQNTTTGTPLSEFSNANFNPTGAPYLGVTDSDQADTYPSEIQGLVHVNGTVTFSGACTIRGLLLCESTAAADAVLINTTPTIIYTSSLYTNPPQGYTSSVPMVPQQTSWLKIVN